MWAGWPSTCFPLNSTFPLVSSSSPMMERSVVVFPAPFRPIRQTISPCLTSKVMFWSTWLAPYQALRFSTRNIASVLPLAKIDALDLVVLTYFGRRALCKQFPVMKNQNAIADSHHQFHLVLDQNDGSFLREFDDEIHHHARFFGAHTGRGLIQQQQPRIGRQRHADFQRTLLAVSQLLG